MRPPPLPKLCDLTCVAFGTTSCTATWYAIYHIAMHKAWIEHSTHQETIMSTITGYDDALDFLPTAEKAQASEPAGEDPPHCRGRARGPCRRAPLSRADGPRHSS